jgi:hypothetical protein
MNLRKIVSTILVAAILFWAPSVIPARAVTGGLLGCGLTPLVMTTVDTAFAGMTVAPLVPCPPVHAPFPWFVVIFGAGVVSVILNAAIVGKTQCRELTFQEAWLSVVLPFIGIGLDQHNNKCHLHP